MSTIPDTPGVVHPDGPEPRKLGNYQSFINSQRGLLAYNAASYVNKRIARQNKFSDSTLKKVLKTATFIPAHPTRYTPGEFRVENMKYFVVHRPGRLPQACTLLNTIREFAQENKPASTHFVIGFNGELVQMVDLQDVAYHCGYSTMPNGKKDGNYTAVGVEVEGAVGEKFTYAQYTTLAKLISTLNDICGFLPDKDLPNFILQAKGVMVGHEEIRPNVKVDPGANFNYALLGYLIKNTPATTRAEWYKPPVNALTALDAALQEIYYQAANPASASEAALLNMASAGAQAQARQMYMLYGNRQDLAQWAANSAASQALGMEEMMASYLQQIARLSASLPDLPATSVAPTLDFDTGLYSDE
jgi:N-acetyl-anhydromuramyl-L-alanine amidase AmpD